MRTPLAFAILLVGACSSDKPGLTVTNHGCTLPTTGVVQAHYVEQPGGTCGAVPDSIINASDVGTKSVCPGGSGNVDDVPLDGGGCKVSANVNDCSVGGATQSYVIAVTWDATYTSATGTTKIDVAGQCSSTYDTTLTHK